MAITKETAMQNKDELAIVCCRTEAGTIIEAANLEDPNIIPDLEDSGLLTIPKDCLSIGQVLGAKLVKTIDSLTPLTPELLEGVTIDDKTEKKDKEKIEPKTPAVQSVANGAPVGGMVKIHIGEGKDINLEFPLGLIEQIPRDQEQPRLTDQNQITETFAKTSEPIIKRRLTKKHFQIDKVEFAAETKIEGTTLYLRKDISNDATKADKLVCSIKVELVTPEDYAKYSETIMDVQPIATKDGSDQLGTGVTRVLDGVVVVVTGTDQNGVQIGEFGSSEGILERNIMWGRPGAPDQGEIFIKTEVVIKEGTNMERPGPLAAHKATDFITQEIREALKKVDESQACCEEELVQYRRPGKKKVVIIKEIMGQGAMHDNIILPFEPVGIIGGKPNVDLGNLPVVLSPLEVLDGGIHALTCIGPASKETSRHYWREPLVIEVLNDQELDLAGIVFVGSPQVNSEKFYVSERLGMLIEAMDVDGAIITTEGFGNNHIDFASHHEQVGQRDVVVVGMSFCAKQGALVVGNEYMKYMIDLNKSEQGIENEILANNTLSPEDAIRATTMLKAGMLGLEIKAPERKFNPHVKLNNVDMIESTTGEKIELVANEQVLPKSKKRLEIYEAEEVTS